MLVQHSKRECKGGNNFGQRWGVGRMLNNQVNEVCLMFPPFPSFQVPEFPTQLKHRRRRVRVVVRSRENKWKKSFTGEQRQRTLLA